MTEESRDDIFADILRLTIDLEDTGHDPGEVAAALLEVAATILIDEAMPDDMPHEHAATLSQHLALSLKRHAAEWTKERRE